MAVYTLTQAQAKLAAVQAAIEAVLTNQEYTINNRTYRRADLRALQAERDYWTGMVESLTRTGAIGQRRVIPVDL